MSLCLTGHFLLQSQSSGSGSGQWGGQHWAKVPAFPALVRCREKWRQKGNVPSLPWPHLHSQPICLLSMWTRRKSKTSSPAVAHFYQTLLLISQVLCFHFSPLSRILVTRGFDCVHIPTLLPKSACVLLVLLATTILQTSALVGNAGTVSFFK